VLLSGCATTTAFWGDPGDLCSLGATIPFDNVVSDPGLNYNAIQHDYQLPARGTYLFQIDYVIDATIFSLIQSPSGPDLIFTIRTHLYEEVSAQDIETRDFTFTDFRPQPLTSTSTASQRIAFSHFFAYTGLAGDRIRPYVEFFNNVTLIQLGAELDFQTGTRFLSNGALVSANSAARTFSTECPISDEQWDAIKANPYQNILLNSQFSGHIRNIEWRPFSVSTVEIEDVVNP
jgi:hypothetical protein